MRLATGQIGRNERHRIYVHDHLAGGLVQFDNYENGPIRGRVVRAVPLTLALSLREREQRAPRGEG